MRLSISSFHESIIINDGAKWLTFVLVSLALVSQQHIRLSEARRPRRQPITFSSLAYRNGAVLSPVVIVPGDGGNRLEAKLDRADRVPYGCSAKADWFQIWVNLGQFTPFKINCLIENIRLVYNKGKKTTSNPQGVQIRVPYFGSVQSVEHLDELRFIGYFDKIVKRLVKDLGYQRDININAAPYDFRKAPNELKDYFKNFGQLIEKSYRTNQNTSVTLICHSMGCLFSQYLLNQKSRAWRDQYVRRIISIAAPWAGSFKAVTTLLLGDDLGVSLLNARLLRRAQITYPSLMFLFPKGAEFERQTLVETENNNYTLANIEGLFKEFKLDDALEIYKLAYPISKNLKAPQVELWCLYTEGIDTPQALKLVNDNRDPILFYGDGDGTVNLNSLESCKYFKQEQPIQAASFPGITHIKSLRSPGLVKYIASIIQQNL